MPTPLDEHGQPHPAFSYARVLQRATDELLGLCKGLVVDGQLSDTEVVALHEWLAANPDVAAEWPGSIIAKRMREILADLVVEDSERRDLVDLLGRVAGGDVELITRENRSTEIAFTDPPPALLFDGRWFCLTGRFAYGPRATCEHAISRRGGRVHARVTRSVHYLVIGTFGSRDWLHSTHGTKIKAAVSHGCAIVSERHWAEQIARA